MHYVDEGVGEPLVFVHGTPTWSFEWRHLIHAFAPTHRCIAPDYIGFGLSERPWNFSYTPEAHAKYLASFIERLGYGDKSKLTPHIHRQYLERFPDRWSHENVLWPLAKALLGAGRYYDSLWQQRGKLHGRPALIIWGLNDSALKSHQLSRWREVLRSARVVELENAGHWPHEEAPDRVIEEMKDFLPHDTHSSARNAP